MNKLSSYYELPWRDFEIHLPSFFEFLEENIPNSDGINASKNACQIVEKSNLTEQEISLILNYYNSLTEQGENQKRAEEEGN